MKIPHECDLKRLFSHLLFRKNRMLSIVCVAFTVFCILTLSLYISENVNAQKEDSSETVDTIKSETQDETVSPEGVPGCTDNIELIQNGNFDTNLSSWTASGSVSQLTGKAVFNLATLPVDGILSQNIPTVIGKKYKITFAVSKATTATAVSKFTVRATDTVTATVITFKDSATDAVASLGIDIYDSISFTATGTTTTISFIDSSISSLNRDIFLDSVTSITGNCTSPGGVSGSHLWVKANDTSVIFDTTTTHVRQWLDQGSALDTTTHPRASAATHTGPISTSSAITRVENGLNFNPAVDFVSSNSRSLKGNMASNWNTATTIFAVGIREGPITISPAGFFSGGSGIGLLVSGTAYELDGSGCTSATTTIDNTVPRIVRGVYTTSLQTNGGSTWSDGKKGATGITCASVGTGAGLFEIGGNTLNGSNVEQIFHGKIPEVIVYKTAMDDTIGTINAQKIESYLAVKYGITLDQTTAQDYLDSTGAVIWSASANSAYNDDIAGIGRDDLSNLNQKQSASVNATNAAGVNRLLTIGHSTISTTNAANPNNFTSDRDFLIWGHDGGSTAISLIGSLTRMQRVWKVQETTPNSVGNVLVQVPVLALTGLTPPALIRSTNNIFSTGDQFFPMTLNGLNYEVSVNLNNGNFFTFGTFVLSAAPVSVSGRVASHNGLSIAGATVYLSDPNGRVLTARTNAFGYYTFQSVIAGQSYVLRVTAKRYSFEPSLLSVNDNLTNVDVIASPPQ